MKKSFVSVALLIVGLVAIAIKLWAVTVNPTSNVLGDSANTGSTLIYRDANGDFSVGIVSATKVGAGDTATSTFHPPALTTTTLLTVAPRAVGDLYVAINPNVTAQFLHLCVATGTAAGAIVISSANASPCKD